MIVFTVASQQLVFSMIVAPTHFIEQNMTEVGKSFRFINKTSTANNLTAFSNLHMILFGFLCREWTRVSLRGPYRMTY